MTNAVVQFGKHPQDVFPSLWIVTSNPFFGTNTWNGQGYNGLLVRFSGSVGAANAVDFDVWDA